MFYQIAGFFDCQYLWKETINVLDLVYTNSYQKKIVSKITSVGWVWQDAYTYQVEFGWSGDCLDTLKIVQNEKAIEFSGNKSLRSSYITQNFKLLAKMCSSPIRS